MKSFFKKLTFFSFAFSPFAFSQNDPIEKENKENLISGSGNGGDAWVCFNIPAEEAVKNGRMTTAGRKAIVSAVPYEIFLANLVENPVGILKKVEDLSFAETLEELNNQFKQIPGLFRVLNSVRTQLGSIQDGIGVNGSLHDVKDGNPIQIEIENCLQVQAVIRQVNQFYYDRLIWNLYTPFQKAIMQLHEELYYLGKVNLKHVNSVNTQLLIVGLLTKETKPNRLKNDLLLFDFGRFDTEEIESDRQRLLSDILVFREHRLKTSTDFRDIERFPNILGASNSEKS